MEQLKDSYHDGSSKTEYCHVYLRNKMKWQYIKSKYVAKIQIDNKIYHKCFMELRQAAIQIDKWLIQAGKQPINILKKQI